MRIVERRSPVGHPPGEEVNDGLPAPQVTEVRFLSEERSQARGVLGVDRRAVGRQQVANREPRLDTVNPLLQFVHGCLP